MAKTSSQRLQTVLKLAALRQQLAAEKLAETIRNADLQQQQQQQLQHYKLEYCTQFSELGAQSGGSNVRANQLANFQRFYQNLDAVGETQQQRIVLAENQCEQARRQWQQLYSREQNMAKLVASKQRQEEKQREDKLQREQDDKRRSPIQ